MLRMLVVAGTLVALSVAVTVANAETYGPSRLIPIAGIRKIDKASLAGPTLPQNTPQYLFPLNGRCGVRRVTFDAFDASEYASSSGDAKTFEWSAMMTTTEDCEVRVTHREMPSLAIVVDWEGTAYVLDFIPLFTDGAGKLFYPLGRTRFASKRKNVRPIVPGGTACAKEKAPMYRRMHAFGETKTVGGVRCFVEGVYLEDLGSRLIGRPAA